MDLPVAARSHAEDTWLSVLFSECYNRADHLPKRTTIKETILKG